MPQISAPLPLAPKVHVPDICVLGIWLIIVVIQVLGKYITILSISTIGTSIARLATISILTVHTIMTICTATAIIIVAFFRI